MRRGYGAARSALAANVQPLRLCRLQRCEVRRRALHKKKPNHDPTPPKSRQTLAQECRRERVRAARHPPRLRQRSSPRAAASRRRGTAGLCSEAAAGQHRKSPTERITISALRAPPHLLHAVPRDALVLRGPPLSPPFRVAAAAAATAAASLILPCSLRASRGGPFFRSRSAPAMRALPTRLQAHRQLLPLPRLAQVRPQRRAAARLSPPAAARSHAVHGRGRRSEARVRLLLAGACVDKARRDIRQGPPNPQHLRNQQLIRISTIVEINSRINNRFKSSAMVLAC